MNIEQMLTRIEEKGWRVTLMGKFSDGYTAKISTPGSELSVSTDESAEAALDDALFLAERQAARQKGAGE